MPIETFPVRLVVPPEDAPRETTASGKACARTRLWYADWHDQNRGSRKHHAQDIFGPSGCEILAPEGGVIVASSRTSGPSPKGGHYVKLEVRNARGAVRTYYLAHLRDVAVEAGTVVHSGALLGHLGRSGNATRTCPHLHIGARRYKGGAAINIFPELVAVDPTRRPAETTGRCR